MAAAYAAHSERFIRAIPRTPALPTAVWINPPATEVANIQYFPMRGVSLGLTDAAGPLRPEAISRCGC